ncbi:hypothetical protein UPYG_G00184470 [Umbra pygmaea]|uniref:BHLH domain-containing protein n=1 Tax=Umbra pygmaea TaxID=75934 RepID=A0ABD0XA32_UMBPY
MATTSKERQYRRPSICIKQEQDDDSDTEESHLGFKKSDSRDSQIIHSGHFMVSSPHIEHPPKKGYDFDTVNKQTCHTYHFGKTSTSHLSIDASLTKLFECMTLAYSGKLVSPKWKNFKGLKLLWRDKIRLNNAIWRAWYMQYVEKRENPVCHFVTPLDGTMDMESQRPAEAIATEGKYSKTRIEIAFREYHKWRTYFKKRLQKHKDDDLSTLLKEPEEQFSLFGEVFPDTFRVSLCQDDEMAGRRAARKSRESPVPMEMDPLFDMDVLMSEFSDTLFSTLASHQPMAWPNPREIAHAGNADMIQPGLIPLQPNLDFMDSFEPLQDLFHSLRQPIFTLTTLPATPVTSVPRISSQSQGQLLPSMHLSAELPVSLDHRLVTSPAAQPISSPMDNEASEPSEGPSYVEDYMPLFSQSGPPSVQGGASSHMQPSAPPTLPHPMPSPAADTATHVSPPPLSDATCLDAPSPPSVITDSPSSPAAPREAVTFSQRPEVGSINRSPPTPLLQPLSPAPAIPLQHPQTFALPMQPPCSNKKKRHVQRIVPASPIPSSHLILTAPFPGHTSAVIVTPTPLKADVVPSAGVVISSSLSRPPGFHILQQPQKSPQLIIPKEETYSSRRRKQSPSPSTGNEGPSSGQGSPCGSEQVSSPQSPLSSTALSKNEASKSRRGTHISAEQKRRFNINIGFKTLCGLVPTLKSQSNISNAATLQKTVEYIGKLQQDRQQMQEETKRLRQEIDELNASINVCQEQLPATGVPISRPRFDYMHEKFDEYVKSRTLQNWKFWIFSIIIKPLFESFNGTVSTTNDGELRETTLHWLDRHCSLPVLRPMVLSSLRQLCKSTSILTDPSLLPEEASQAVSNTHRHLADC